MSLSVCVCVCWYMWLIRAYLFSMLYGSLGVWRRTGTHTHAPCSLQRSICYGGRHTPHTHTQPPKGCRSGSNDINGTSHVRCLCGNAAPAVMVAQVARDLFCTNSVASHCPQNSSVQLGSSFFKAAVPALVCFGVQVQHLTLTPVSLKRKIIIWIHESLLDLPIWERLFDH